MKILRLERITFSEKEEKEEKKRLRKRLLDKKMK